MQDSEMQRILERAIYDEVIRRKRAEEEAAKFRAEAAKCRAELARLKRQSAAPRNVELLTPSSRIGSANVRRVRLELPLDLLAPEAAPDKKVVISFPLEDLAEAARKL